MLKRVLIANRGEVAVRIARAASELGIASVAVFSADDAASPHRARADRAVPLAASGPAAYLDGEALVAAARGTGCDAVHPGYGFLSESAAFARACEAAGLVFVGPRPGTLETFGDKVRARRLAAETGLPVARGTGGATTLAEAGAFLASLDGRPAMVKARAGGGGRGMRVVRDAAELAEAFPRAASEAQAAFGSGELYIEELIRPARHIEVQTVGDGEGGVAHLYERECSLQRRHQKLVEIAPAPHLDPALRDAMTAAAVRLAAAAGLRSLCTIEFLVDPAGDRFVFMEANPRLQVEHPVTEEVMGVDLVATQLRIASGAALGALGLDQAAIGRPRGAAIEVRVNMERVRPDGSAVPTGGTLAAFDPPGGPGIRIETFGATGYSPSTAFDPLLAKVIATSPDGGYAAALQRAERALAEFRIAGVATNIGLLRALLRLPDVRGGRFDTGFVERHLSNLCEAADRDAARDMPSPAGAPAPDPGRRPRVQAPAGTVAVTAPLGGRIVGFEVAPGAGVHAGSPVAVLEAMKMEHVVPAGLSGFVRALAASPGDTVALDEALLFIAPAGVAASAAEEDAQDEPGRVRPDLAEVLARHEALLDAARPEAVARRRRTGQRTARENIDDLCDPGSFTEYGGLALAAQRRRRPMDELVRVSPADGLVAGIGSVNGDRFGQEDARCLVMSYDYTVFAGTQGFMNHKKMDRLFGLAKDWRLPIVLFAEGGGGRPGETDHMGVAGLDLTTFRQFGTLSGLVPLVAIVSGRCFAGNAALAGCSDLVIATETSNLGMGGPAMIEGGGLGRFAPEAVGPAASQVANGVIDILVADEAAAVATAKRYLAYLQGPVGGWTCDDQAGLRAAIPENRLRAYAIRPLVERLADTGTVLELRPSYGLGMVTALIRIEGRPLGLIANDPAHLGGAIDAEGAEKAARFIDLCEAFGLPILSLCDTPGFMVGPEAEETGLVRRVSRMFVAAANITVPYFTIVLRKGYGLGAQAMAGGSFLAPFFNVSWPTGEFGGMGLEGAVQLGYRAELAAIADPEDRKRRHDALLAELHERGKAINMASFLEIDGVIDPATSRRWIVRGLDSLPKPPPRTGKRRPYVTPR